MQMGSFDGRLFAGLFCLVFCAGCTASHDLMDREVTTAEVRHALYGDEGLPEKEEMDEVEAPAMDERQAEGVLHFHETGKKKMGPAPRLGVQAPPPIHPRQVDDDGEYLRVKIEAYGNGTDVPKPTSRSGAPSFVRVRVGLLPDQTSLTHDQCETLRTGPVWVLMDGKAAKKAKVGSTVHVEVFVYQDRGKDQESYSDCDAAAIVGTPIPPANVDCHHRR